MLDKKMSLKRLKEMADIICIKDYELMEIEEKFAKNSMSYLDVLAETIKCIQHKNDSAFRKF